MRLVIINGTIQWRDLREGDPEPHLQPYQHDIIKTFFQIHKSTYTPIERIKFNEELKNNTFLMNLLISPIGHDIIIFAIRYELSLMIPQINLNESEISLGMILTHLFKRKSGGMEFITANGLYGMYKGEGMSLYSQQMIKFPDTIRFDILNNFETNFIKKQPNNLN